MSRSSSSPQTDTERYERLLEMQSLMTRVAHEIGPAIDLDQVLSTVLRAMRKLVDCDGALISLVEDDLLRVVAMDPAPAVAPATTAFRPAAGIAGRVLAHGSSERSDDLRVDDRVPPDMRSLVAGSGVASYLCVPLVCLGQIIGTIQTYAAEPHVFDDDDQFLLDGLASQVAGAIESARRYQMITQLEVLKSDFISRVSHELRTPITIMSGFVSTLLTNHDRIDSTTRQRMLERVDVATARLSGLIDQLLLLSRLEAGVVAATTEPVVLADVLAEVRRQSEMPEAVEISCPAGLLVTSDASLLVRALGLLVDNALKYAGSCRLVAADGVVEVIDAGPGIPSSHRSQVFERFTRANIDTTVAGMGIGLPMARTLLAAAGADLKIADPPGGVGTRMVARFW